MLKYKSCRFGEIGEKVYPKILFEMGESRKTELFLKGALRIPHCLFIGIKYGNFTFLAFVYCLRNTLLFENSWN
jgi:hypothetical protein